MRHGDAYAPTIPPRRLNGRRARGVVALGALVLLATPGSARDETSDLDTGMAKANYLVRLTPFIIWPAIAFDRPTDPLAICVIGDDPFGPMLDAAAKGQVVGAHPVVVRRAPDLTPDLACHVIYARSVAGGPLRIFASVARQPVLTVADDIGAGYDGAMLHFVTTTDRVRFAIDLAPVEASGLTLSSKLLDLAITVRKAAR